MNDRNFTPQKYIFTDYAVLSALTRSSRNLTDLFLRICSAAPLPPSYGQLCGGLARLSAGGLITSNGGIYSLTPDGTEFFAKNKKWLESAEKRDTRLTKRLLSEPFEPCADICELPDISEYYNALRIARSQYNITDPVINVEYSGNGTAFTFCGYGINPVSERDSDILPDDDEADHSRAEFICPFTAGYDILTAFCRAVCDMAFTYIPLRKLCLSCADVSYVLTLSKNTGSVRITAAPIRYNRQRFGGKENGDLDYAQCGDLILDFTAPKSILARDTSYALASLAWSPDKPDIPAIHPFPLKEMENMVGI